MNMKVICPCGKILIVVDPSRIGRTKYCSKKCFYRYRPSRPRGLKYKIVVVNKGWFKKGCIPWSSGTIGVCKANKGSAKKGEHRSRGTEFFKGQKAWNKNKKIFKGSKYEYGRIHRWIMKNKGKPKICILCKSKKKLVWANKSQEYRMNINDFISLCISCHIKNDMKIIKSM